MFYQGPYRLQFNDMGIGLACVTYLLTKHIEKNKAARDWSRLLSVFTDEQKSSFLL